MDEKRGYHSTGDDNGRCEGGFTELTTEHVIGHLDYGKKDVEGSSEIEREVNEEWR